MKRVVHPPHVYLTNTPVSFEVVISDQMTDVSFEYTWTRNGTVVGVGHLPRYTYTFETAGWYYFQVHVNMSSNDTRMANSRRNGVFEKHFLLKGNGNTHLFNSSGHLYSVYQTYSSNILMFYYFVYLVTFSFSPLHIFVSQSSPSCSCLTSCQMLFHICSCPAWSY